MILVTGATGLVGGNLMWQLLQENEKIYAIRRVTSDLKPLRTIFNFYTSTPDEYLTRIEWITAEVLDVESLRKAMTNITFVYHCAAIVSLGSTNGNLLDVNVTGTKNIVDIALESGIKKLCFVSSIAACGSEKGKNAIDENSPWKENPTRSVYALSKYKSEQEVWKAIYKGLDAVIVNPGVILGVSGTNSGSSELFNRVRNGLAFYTNGGSGYVDVQDVVRAMIHLTNSNISGERFILVARNCSNKEVLNWMADGFGTYRPFVGVGKHVLAFIGFLSEISGKWLHFKPLIDKGTARSATHRAYYSNEKIQKTIGFEFASIEKSVRDICSFMNKNIAN